MEIKEVTQVSVYKCFHRVAFRGSKYPNSYCGLKGLGLYDEVA
tara:strand:- start:19122 stop:19250 length:129 start_codon:yes stop_codon:yes gene_type:complete